MNTGYWRNVCLIFKSAFLFFLCPHIFLVCHQWHSLLFLSPLRLSFSCLSPVAQPLSTFTPTFFMMVTSGTTSCSSSFPPPPPQSSPPFSWLSPVARPSFSFSAHITPTFLLIVTSGTAFLFFLCPYYTHLSLDRHQWHRLPLLSLPILHPPFSWLSPVARPSFSFSDHITPIFLLIVTSGTDFLFFP